MRKKFAHRRPGRNRTGRRRSRNKSIAGSLILEVIAIVALIMMLSNSKFGKEAAHSPPDDLTANRTTEFGSMITGFLTDQLARNQLN